MYIGYLAIWSWCLSQVIALVTSYCIWFHNVDISLYLCYGLSWKYQKYILCIHSTIISTIIFLSWLDSSKRWMAAINRKWRVSKYSNHAFLFSLINLIRAFIFLLQLKVIILYDDISSFWYQFKLISVINNLGKH